MKIEPIIIRQIKGFLFPILIIVVVVFLSVKFIFPAIVTSKEMLETKKGNERLLVQLTNKKAKLDELKNSSLLANYEHLEQVLPYNKDIALILNSLVSLEKETGVIIEVLSFNPGSIKQATESAQPVIELPIAINIQVEVSGSEEALSLFFSKLNRTAPIYSVNNLKYTTLNEGYAYLSLSTYYQPLPESLGEIETPLKNLTVAQENVLLSALEFKLPPEYVDIDFIQSTSSGEIVKTTEGIFTR